MVTPSDNKMRRKYVPSLILPSLIFILLTGLFAEDIQCVWTDVERIVAVGDVHGDFNNFMRILKFIDIVDNQNHWKAGKTHLVQIGDVMDRGIEAKRIFDLLRSLEKEAEEAGGKVHVLIGNHEEINIINRAFEVERYVPVKQFVDFLPDEYRQKRERRIRRKLGLNDSDNTDSDSNLHPELYFFWENILKNARKNRNSEEQREYYKGFINTHGNWILENNVVIKINGIIFVHGGISLKNSTKTLKYINDRMRLELKDSMLYFLKNRPPRIMNNSEEFLYDQNSPLWYRRYAVEEEDVFKDIVNEILNNLEADRIVTAHTPVALENVDAMSKYGGKIWIIDTSISEAYGKGALSALIIKDYGKSIEPWWMPRPDEKQSASLEYSKQIQEIIHWIAYFGIPPFSGYCLNSNAMEKNVFLLWGKQ